MLNIMWTLSEICILGLLLLYFNPYAFLFYVVYFGGVVTPLIIDSLYNFKKKTVSR